MIKAPNQLNGIIADYAPAEAVRMMTVDHYDAPFITPTLMREAQKVKEFLIAFNRQSFLLFYTAEYTVSPAAPWMERDLMTQLRIGNNPPTWKPEIHLKEDTDSLIEGYKSIRTLITHFAAGWNEHFNARHFRTDLFGFGYVRPHVQFSPDPCPRMPVATHYRLAPGNIFQFVTIDDTVAEETEEERTLRIWKPQQSLPHPRNAIMLKVGSEVLSDSKLLPHAKKPDPEVAEETARMLSEVGAIATPAMVEAATADKQSGVANVIEEQQAKK